jgi:hypothetical protein
MAEGGRDVAEMTGPEVPLPKKVVIRSGPPGCGKSTTMREEAISQAGRYIFFVPTLALLKEQVAEFAEDRKRLFPSGKDIKVYEAHSDKGHGLVQRKLDDARAAVEMSAAAHVVIFTTHDALMTKNLSGFKDWHARIDEAPNAVKGGTIDMTESWQWFDAYFDLSPVGSTGWSNLSLKGAPPNWKKLAKDSLLKGQVDFVKLAPSPGGVFVNTDKWAGVEKVDWWWLWTPSALKDFATIEIAGASYHKSLGAIVARKWFANSLSLTNKPIPMVRDAHPTVRVHFFTNGHKPATTFWETSNGRRMVKAVCDYLSSFVPDLGFWSGNDEVLKLMEWRVSGDLTRPKVMGQNKWRNLTKCAFIFSSGPTPDDRAIMETFEISEDEVYRAREDEDILQFAMRGAIRKRDFGGRFDVYVYTEDQANALAASLTSSGIGTVEIVAVPEAGIMDATFAKTKRSRSHVALRPRGQKPAPAKVLNPATGIMVLPRSLKRSQRRAANDKGKVKRPRGRPRKARPAD